jgi:hypothetical protein
MFSVVPLQFEGPRYPYGLKLLIMNQRLLEDMLVTPDVNKKGVIRGAGWLDKNDVTRGQANSSGVPPYPKVNKAEEITYLTISIVMNHSFYQFKWTLTPVKTNP